MDTSRRQTVVVNHYATTKPLLSIELDEPQRVWFPGQVIHGTVRLSSLAASLSSTTTCIQLHLTCVFQLGDGSRKILLLKVIVPSQPCHGQTQLPFNIAIPTSVPSTVDDKTIAAKVQYKIKAVYQIPGLPTTLYPKTSIPVHIKSWISANDIAYSAGLKSEKDATIIIPRDIIMSAVRLRKDEERKISATLSIPRSCYLPDQSISFSLKIQHVAPIKQMQGVHVHLERVTHIVLDGMTSIDTVSVAEMTLPLICDTKDFTATITSGALKVPLNISSTIDNTISPLNIFYRIRVTLNMDMTILLDEPHSRKRDRAYSVVTRMMSWNDDLKSPRNNTTLSLDLPVVIGTTDASKETMPIAPLKDPALSLDQIYFQHLQSNRFSNYDTGDKKFPPRTDSLPTHVPDIITTPPDYYAHTTFSSPILMKPTFYTQIPRQPSAPHLQDIELSPIYGTEPCTATEKPPLRPSHRYSKSWSLPVLPHNIPPSSIQSPHTISKSSTS
ncbi:uncharacterized protein BYT42DRAFT_581294 [Radiomyces spectabilis]|uniref:uncharacterized protein n=1 Tax=Radiomyces spectabilis TaxID=64574 RepID=UPI00221F6FB2|nr:uncharacterized protein BYT42DRAFT_581294 [Radiomyces spectabilis]KAI8371730.1 hypothetical protein BYT42DRAFT_581294 [Radiomyces spectabilis]